LLANIHGTFDWHEYKRYVGEYLQSNAAKVAAGKDALHVAAKQVKSSWNDLLNLNLLKLFLANVDVNLN
jgi:hypothetical protein